MKAAGRVCWKAKWIKKGGEKMVKSFYMLFKRIKTENEIPVTNDNNKKYLLRWS